MKIIILGKSNQLGATPNIRVKGMSQLRYNFVWDKEIRHFAYEPEDQKQVNDIFRTQGKLYKTMFFSVWLDTPEVKKEAPKKTVKKAKKAKSQPVAEELAVS